MSIILHEKEGLTAYVKGAPEVILQRSTHILKEGNILPLDKTNRNKIESAYETMAKNGPA